MLLQYVKNGFLGSIAEKHSIVSTLLNNENFTVWKRKHIPSSSWLKRAILDIFHETMTADDSAICLSAFKLNDWVRCYRWLNSSGLTLYFLDRVKKLGIVSVLPPQVLLYLEKNQVANRERIDSLFAEFIVLNKRFQAKNISYFNIKGFTLAPASCSTPVLRIQRNLDFVMSANDAELCHDVLADLGYCLVRFNEHVWEFEADCPKPAYPLHTYEVPPQRSVKVYAVSPTSASEKAAYQQLLHKRLQTWNEHTFPVASNADAFINQSLHIFGRICSEWTRLSWLIEYKNCLDFWREDDNFFKDVRQKAQSSSDRVLAIGISLAIIKEILGAVIPPPLEEWTIFNLSASVQLWIHHFAEEALMADYPGTKRYLFLKSLLPPNENIDRDEQQQLSDFYSQLGTIPPKKRLRYSSHTTLAKGYSKILRIKFHLRENFRNMASAGLWKKLLSEAKEREMRRVY